MAFLKKFGSFVGNLFGTKQKPETKAKTRGTFSGPATKPARGGAKAFRVEPDPDPIADFRDQFKELNAQISRTGKEIQRDVGRVFDEAIDNQPWYPLISSNVDRIRYSMGEKILQVIYKNGWQYQWDGVDPAIFQGYLQTHSPGQYSHYVVQAYYGLGRLLGKGHGVSAPAAARFDGTPYAVPDWVEKLMADRTPNPDHNLPVAKGVMPPPPSWTGS